MKIRRTAILHASATAGLLGFFGHAVGQQVADPTYRPEIEEPMHARGTGPLVLIDAGHNNFHTKDGRYGPFAALLEADGYEVESHEGLFSVESLSGTSILVISNALNAINTQRWALPTPSAFADSEIEAVVAFVASGGGLLLIADHMPFPGAAAELAARFSVEFSNGFVLELDEAGQVIAGPTIFARSAGKIGDHPITRGRNDREAIGQIASFTGSAFPITGNAVSLFRFGADAVMLVPTVAWEFTEHTSRAMVAGWSQGAAIEHGNGRVVVAGEAAMFSSQRSGDNPPMGMTSAQASDNQQLLLNIVRWLASDL